MIYSRRRVIHKNRIGLITHKGTRAEVVHRSNCKVKLKLVLSNCQYYHPHPIYYSIAMEDFNKKTVLFYSKIKKDT